MAMFKVTPCKMQCLLEKIRDSDLKLASNFGALVLYSALVTEPGDADRDTAAGPANKQQPTLAANGKAKQKAAELDDLSDFEMDASDEEADGADTQLGDDDEEEEDIGPANRSEADDEADDSDGQEQLLSTLRSLIDQKKEEEAKGQTSKTAHELRQARIAEKARRLEEENMMAKDWHMRGEVRAGTPRLRSSPMSFG